MAKCGGPSGNLTWPLNPSNKTKNKNTRKTTTKNNKTNKKQTQQNKEGLGPSEVALWATSPDP